MSPCPLPFSSAMSGLFVRQPPFAAVQSFAQEGVGVADVELRAPGPWPEGIPFMRGLIRYQPTQFTQSIFKLESRPTIRKVSRYSLEEKYQVPGGMEGLTGWKSDLYKYIPEGGMLWQEPIPVKNSFGNYQYEVGHKRVYPSGTVFVDVLSNSATGKVFEKRIREKQGGVWQEYVSFKDVDQRPVGYYGLKVSCSSCHNDAGTGGYGVGLVPGGDTVISDPLLF